METPIRVVIADDNADMRRIERMMISRAEGFEIVGEAEDGVQLLTLVEQKKPQLVFLDVEMPGKTGVECARAGDTGHEPCDCADFRDGAR